MSKELLIMRHAKSSWNDPSLSDHDRPLNQRGLRDAPRMANCLNEQNLVPDLILSSSALRARTTAKMVCDNLNCADLQLEIVDDFYHAPPDTYIEYLARLADQYQRPMVVGHNPGLEELVSHYDSNWQSMPTAAIAHVSLGIARWCELDLDHSDSTLTAVYRPKELAF